MDLIHQHIGNQIKEKATSMGFLAVGFSPAKKLLEARDALSDWLDKGYHASMEYMNNHFEKRIDPSQLVENSKSVISLLYNYYPSQRPNNNNAPKIARYAYGKDYHKVLKKKLKHLYQYIKTELYPDLEGRYFVDSAPILERSLAQKAGLGWIGKNSLLINPKFGSYFFICELIVNLDLPSSPKINNYCGGCSKCIEACPTNAIVSPGVIDSNQCISYQTIENKDEIPTELKGKFNNWVFGCDICQEVCPWNRKASPTNEVAFYPTKRLLDLTKEEWLNINETDFDSLFEGSAVKRTKYTGLKRNLNFISDL